MSDKKNTNSLDRALRVALRGWGVRSRYVETEVSRHHVYETTSGGRLPTIVFLPGLLDSAAMQIPVLARVRGQARRVLILESAGHGLSGPSRGEYTVARHLLSIASALDELLDEPAILVGNSLGGATALHYAATRPDKVCGLFLTSPAGAPFDEGAAAFVRGAFTMTSQRGARAFLDLVFHRPPMLAPLLARLIQSRASSPAVLDILRSLETEYTAPGALTALTMPVTLLWGRSERILPQAALEYFRTHLPTHAAILEPSELGHCPHLDDPARLARLVTAFARSVARRENAVTPDQGGQLGARRHYPRKSG